MHLRRRTTLSNGWDTWSRLTKESRLVETEAKLAYAEAKLKDTKTKLAHNRGELARTKSKLVHAQSKYRNMNKFLGTSQSKNQAVFTLALLAERWRWYCPFLSAPKRLPAVHTHTHAYTHSCKQPLNKTLTLQ